MLYLAQLKCKLTFKLSFSSKVIQEKRDTTGHNGIITLNIPILPIVIYTVLESTGVPVTGTPSILLEFNFIVNRWTIYITTSCLIDRWQGWHIGGILPITDMPILICHNRYIGR